MNASAHLELRKVVVVTGMSGAGKTVAVNALEDVGYYCVDNLPPPVLEATLTTLAEAGEKRIAFGIDVRAREYLTQAVQAVHALMQRSRTELSVLYLDASDELLARRFSATRRPHPLTSQGAPGVRALFDGIHRERELMAPLRAAASVVVDSTNLSVHELRREVLNLFEGRTDGRLLARVLSFGFKYGAPRDADIVLDVRFLPNPYFDEKLRTLSGLDPAVAEFVLEQIDTNQFLELARALVAFSLPRFREEGKAYATIAIGCTGGRHRSVALAEHLVRTLRTEVDLNGIDLEAAHRDMHRADPSQSPGSSSS